MKSSSKVVLSLGALAALGTLPLLVGRAGLMDSELQTVNKPKAADSRAAPREVDTNGVREDSESEEGPERLPRNAYKRSRTSTVVLARGLVERLDAELGDKYRFPELVECVSAAQDCESLRAEAIRKVVSHPLRYELSWMADESATLPQEAFTRDLVSESYSEGGSLMQRVSALLVHDHACARTETQCEPLPVGTFSDIDAASDIEARLLLDELREVPVTMDERVYRDVAAVAGDSERRADVRLAAVSALLVAGHGEQAGAALMALQEPVSDDHAIDLLAPSLIDCGVGCLGVLENAAESRDSGVVLASVVAATRLPAGVRSDLLRTAGPSWEQGNFGWRVKSRLALLRSLD